MMLWILLSCAPPAVVAPATTEILPNIPHTDCMANCLRQNMARSVDHALIKADCEAACKAKVAGKIVPTPLN